jgi:hypothetical protein
MKIVVGIVFAVVLVVVLGWLGLQIDPRPFPPYPGRFSEPDAEQPEAAPLPEGLPAPVERFYWSLYGDEVPVVESAVITGRASMRVGGLLFPARFRFTHVAGQGYRHYIEATWFGLPILRVNESYLDGQGRMELPFGTIEGEPKIDQAANLGLWAESIWLSSLWVTDPRVTWAPVDAQSALLQVPSGARAESGLAHETFVVRFDPQTGLLDTLEAMRYREADDSRRTLWINQIQQWANLDGQQTAVVGAVTWFDQGRPWAVFRVEEIVLNADVDAYIRRKGI